MGCAMSFFRFQAAQEAVNRSSKGNRNLFVGKMSGARNH